MSDWQQDERQDRYFPVSVSVALGPFLIILGVCVKWAIFPPVVDSLVSQQDNVFQQSNVDNYFKDSHPQNFIVISTTRCTATLLSARTTRTHGRRGWSQQSNSPSSWSSPSSTSITRSRLFLTTQSLEFLRRGPLHTERWNDHRILKVLMWMPVEKVNFR